MGYVLLRNAEILDPEAKGPSRGGLLLEDGRIRARLRPGDRAPEDAAVFDLDGLRLAPGFVDLHYHGSTVFHDADSVGGALRRDSASLARHGTTAFLATTLTQPMTRLAQTVTQLASSMSNSAWPGAEAIGLHLEGPWINPNAAGAQPREGITPFAAPDGAEVLERGEGSIRMVTLAPEVEGAARLQAELSQRGIAAALGHSLASAEVAAQAVERGARHVTHLFNAMGQLHHRAPGLAGAALSDRRLSCDLICDGAHVHPSMVAVAARAKADGLVLITDHVDPPATAAGAPALAPGSLRGDERAWQLADGRLAGSRVTLDASLRNLLAFAGVSLLEAVAACSLRPARVLGIEGDRGSLRPGARADLAVLDESLRVRETWIAGRRVYPA